MAEDTVNTNEQEQVLTVPEEDQGGQTVIIPEEPLLATEDYVVQVGDTSGVDVDELQKQYAQAQEELKQKKAALEQQDALKNIGTQVSQSMSEQQRQFQTMQQDFLKKANTGQPVTPTPPSDLTFEALMNDPTKALNQYLVQNLKPVLSQYQNKITELETALTQNTVASQNKDLFNKYGDEINSLAQQMGGNAQAYTNAVNQVKANHFDDIVQEAVAKALTEQTGGQGTGVNTPPVTTAAPVQRQSFSSTSAASRPGGTSAGPRTVRITQAKQQAIYDRALKKGHDPKAYLAHVIETGRLDEF